MKDPYGVVSGGPVPHTRSRQSRRVWLEGGSSTEAWGEDLIGWILGALGVGLVLAALFPEQATVSWLVMLVPLVVAFRRSVPRGLFGFRLTDLLYGVTLGLLLRAVAGWVESAGGGTLPWPRYDTSSSLWWWSDAVAPVLVAPLVEELFFHGLVLVVVYTVLRRGADSSLPAAAAALLVSTGLFVAAHVATGSGAASWEGPAIIAMLGLTGGAVVLITGRIWGAVLIHLVFNLSYVTLGVVGTIAGGGAPGLA